MMSLSTRPAKSVVAHSVAPAPAVAPVRRPIVLVATCMDRASATALERGASLATTVGAELRLVHVAAHRVPSHPERTFRVAERTRSYKRAIREWARFETGLEISERKIHIRYGKVPTNVNAVSRAVGAELLIVGGRSDHGSPETGRKVRAMIQRMSCPILLASPPKDGDILVATDLEDPSIPVVCAAVDFGRSVGRKVSLVHNVRVGSASVRVVLPRMISEQLVLGPLARLDGLVRGAPVLEDATVTCRHSTAAAVLELARAREADLLVVGAKEELGGTARDVLDNAVRSVLVVPTERVPPPVAV